VAERPGLAIDGGYRQQQVSTFERNRPTRWRGAAPIQTRVRRRALKGLSGFAMYPAFDLARALLASRGRSVQRPCRDEACRAAKEVPTNPPRADARRSVFIRTPVAVARHMAGGKQNSNVLRMPAREIVSASGAPVPLVGVRMGGVKNIQIHLADRHKQRYGIIRMRRMR
jgi:hypothetical protein